MTPAPAPTAFILDLDGVVTDTAVQHEAAWRRMLEDRGLPFRHDAYERTRGRSRADSLRVLLDRPQDRRLYPTHGAPVEEHHGFVAALLDHRLAREAGILNQLATGPKSARDIVDVLYADVRKELHKPAARSVLSHLRKLLDEDVVEVAIEGASTVSSKTVWVRR